jgi:hypothetical protein
MWVFFATFLVVRTSCGRMGRPLVTAWLAYSRSNVLLGMLRAIAVHAEFGFVRR